jgi:hypothetical protein
MINGPTGHPERERSGEGSARGRGGAGRGAMLAMLGQHPQPASL